MIEQSESHSELMDGVYRLQRHFYDATRKYFLFGRDQLIKRITEGSPKRYVEVGCGTGRNLALIKKRAPEAELYGLDVSNEMLKQAEKNLQSYPDVELRFAYAESFRGSELFGVENFDRVYFSYSLSMIPDWEGALMNGLKHLAPGGSLWIVDFWDQGGYPKWFQALLQKWLDLFHVRFEPKLLLKLKELEREGKISLQLEPVGRRYGYIAKISLL